MSLAEGRVACAVAGAVAGKGGAYQCRIHSGGAIDLDLFSPGGEGVVGKHIHYREGGGAMDRKGELGKKRCSEGWLHRHQRGNRDANPLWLHISVIT